MLRGRSQLWGEASGLLVGLLVFAMIGSLAPWLWWLVVPMILILTYVLAVLVTRAIWIDARAGVVRRRSWLLRPTSYPLENLTDVSMVALGASSAALRLTGPRFTVHIPIVSQTLFGSASQDVDALRRLVEIVAPLPGGEKAAARLRAQIKHAEHGGGVQGSPLVDGI
jgi:hypothetical protein